MDDKTILKYFCMQISKILGFPTPYPDLLKKSKRLTITSIYFFRRFYSFHELKCYDPRLILLSCIFLAGKVEHDFVHMKNLLEIYNGKFTEDLILNNEILVLETMNFDLKVFHPQNCLYSIISDIKRIANTSSPQNSFFSVILNEWLQKAEDIMWILELSDAIFIPAPTLAICSLLLADPPSFQPILNYDFNHYIHEKFDNSVTNILNKLLSQVNEIHNMYLEAKAPLDMIYLQDQMVHLKSIQTWNNNNHPTDT